jgi:hypothetical protein
LWSQRQQGSWRRWARYLPLRAGGQVLATHCTVVYQYAWHRHRACRQRGWGLGGWG